MWNNIIWSTQSAQLILKPTINTVKCPCIITISRGDNKVVIKNVF